MNSNYFSDFPTLFLGFFFFAFGAIIGSFLNVLIHRLPREESVVFPNSACPSCTSPIKPYDNIPILSWLLLRGRCRQCQTSISIRYPLVELITALLFLLTFAVTGFTVLLPFNLLFVSAIVVLVFIDAEHMILPDAINYPATLIVLITRIALPLLTGASIFNDLQTAPLLRLNAPLWLTSLIGAILGAAAGGGSLWVLGWLWKKLRGVEAMGFGDVKMMLWVGAFLGWRATFLTLFLAAATGALVGIWLVVSRRERDFQTQIPFGIFLGIGSIITLFFGDSIINWYLSNFVPGN